MYSRVFDENGLLTCTRCAEKKPKEGFPKDRQCSLGISSTCKVCKAKESKARRLANLEKYRARDKAKRSDPDVREKYRLYSLVYNRERVALETRLVRSAKERAKKKGLSFNLLPEDIRIPTYCPLLGIPLRQNTKTACPNSPSLDRKDPSRGYTKDNVWVISYRANAIKNDATPEELFLIADNLRKAL